VFEILESREMRGGFRSATADLDLALRKVSPPGYLGGYVLSVDCPSRFTP